MKKLLYLFSAIAFIFTSCSNDDSLSEQSQLTTEGTLLRRATSTSGSNTSTEDYFYVGNKISKIVSSQGTKLQFTYSNDLISKSEYFENNVLKSTDYYQYNNEGKIIERKTTDNITAYRSDFIYNSDGTILVKGYNGTVTTQNNQIVDRKVFLFANGDVEKIEAYSIENGVQITKTNYYTYDDKNATSNQIIGYNKIKFWDTGTSGNSHNNISIQYTTSQNSNTYTDELAFTYNSYDYPKTVNFGGYNIEYFYQLP